MKQCEVPDISPYFPADLKKAKNGYLAFCDWEEQWKPNYKYSEVQLVHEGELYGGTIDIIAEKDGKLGAGDRIVGVGQETDGVMVDVIGWRVDEAVTLIRGPRDTVVRLAVIPANQPDTGSTRTIQLTRNEVKLEEQAAKSKIVEVERDGARMKIGIIELPAFYVDFEGIHNKDPDYKSSTRDVAVLVEKLKAEDVDGIVVDLRANGGGALYEAVDLCGLFIGPGPMVQVKNAENRVQVLNNPDARAIYTGPLAVRCIYAEIRPK